MQSNVMIIDNGEVDDGEVDDGDDDVHMFDMWW